MPAFYIYSIMYTQTNISPKINTSQLKAQVQTPVTADTELSLAHLNLGTSKCLKNQLGNFWASQQLIQISTNKFLNQISLSSHQKLISPTNQRIIEQNLKDSSLRISLTLMKQNRSTKKLIKHLCKSIEDDQFITLIFEKQYEKFNIQKQSINKIQINLLSDDGYNRKIWQLQIDQNKIQKEEQQDFIIAQDNRLMCSAKFDVKRQAQTYLKPIHVRVPKIKIQEFYTEKYQLLNKSQLLNTLQSIVLLKGILYPLSKQNMGSRIIQKLLGKANQEEINSVIYELKPYLVQMATDKYGNYVLQKIFKISSSNMKQKCLSFLENKFTELLKSKQGTFCLQGIIDKVERSSLIRIQQILKQQLIQLCNNEFATHFIQKFIKNSIKNKLSNSLMNQILEHFSELALNKYGIVVLKTVIQVTSSNQTLRYQFLNQCLANFNTICQDQYGHYIVIELFSFYNFYQLSGLLTYLSQYVVYLSQNQFSSSILKTTLQLYGDYISILFINQIINEGLIDLMQSSSGNFILHRILEITKNEQYRHKILSQMKKLYPEISSYEKRTKWMNFLA